MSDTQKIRKTDMLPKEVNKLQNFFKPYLGFNTERLFQERFVENYFNTIFERVAAVRILYKFRPLNLEYDDKIEYWDKISYFCNELGNLVYKHEGLLTSVDIFGSQAHWGYPIYTELSYARTLFTFALDAIRFSEYDMLMNYSIILFIGQCYVSSIGTRSNQKYCACPELFLRLPDISQLPQGIIADKGTRDIIQQEIGADSAIISLMSI